MHAAGLFRHSGQCSPRKSLLCGLNFRSSKVSLLILLCQLLPFKAPSCVASYLRTPCSRSLGLRHCFLHENYVASQSSADSLKGASPESSELISALTSTEAPAAVHHHSNRASLCFSHCEYMMQGC